jgi:hypothetical protein
LSTTIEFDVGAIASDISDDEDQGIYEKLFLAMNEIIH